MTARLSTLILVASLGVSSAIRAEEMPSIFDGKSPNGWIAEGRTERQVDGKTLLTVHAVVTRTTAQGEFALEGMEQGWNEQLDKLAEFLAPA